MNEDVALFRSANFTTREGRSDAETILVTQRDINFLSTIVCRHSNSGFGRLKPNTDVAGSYANKNQHQDKDTQSTSELFANYAKCYLL